MIRYIVIPEQKKVIAVLQNTDFDAIYKIRKNLRQSNVIVLDENKYKMKHFYRASVKCHGDDTFDVEHGKDLAKKKLLDKYYYDLDSIMYDAKTELRLAMERFKL